MASTQGKCLYRHELKHYIHPWDVELLRQRLSRIAMLDPHAGIDGQYRIRSLYFDTPDDRALKEKLYGVDPREKFRIRYYNGDTTFIRLEKKMKRNNATGKVSASVNREECEKILEGDLEWMSKSKDPLIAELYFGMKYQALQPKTIVEYSREAYRYPYGNVRITIDSNIHTGLNVIDLFSLHAPLVPVNEANPIILEIKYDQYLPTHMRDLIQLGNRRPTAFSKYAISRVFC